MKIYGEEYFQKIELFKMFSPVHVCHPLRPASPEFLFSLHFSILFHMVIKFISGGGQRERERERENTITKKK